MNSQKALEERDTNVVGLMHPLGYILYAKL